MMAKQKKKAMRLIKKFKKQHIKFYPEDGGYTDCCGVHYQTGETREEEND